MSAFLCFLKTDTARLDQSEVRSEALYLHPNTWGVLIKNERHPMARRHFQDAFSDDPPKILLNVHKAYLYAYEH